MNKYTQRTKICTYTSTCTHTVAQWHSHRVNTICGCSVVENLCSFLFIAFIHSLSFVLFIFVSRSLLLLLPAASHFLVICCLLDFYCVTVILTYLTFNCRVHKPTHTYGTQILTNRNVYGLLNGFCVFCSLFLGLYYGSISLFDILLSRCLDYSFDLHCIGVHSFDFWHFNAVASPSDIYSECQQQEDKR